MPKALMHEHNYKLAGIIAIYVATRSECQWWNRDYAIMEKVENAIKEGVFFYRVEMEYF